MPMKRFSRTKLLLGEPAVRKLAAGTVAVFGLGGVGSYAVEALARGGIGRLRIIDFDEIKYSNFNRQLYAIESTVGRKKVDIAAERIAQINPGCDIDARPVFADVHTIPDLLLGADVAIDAIDSLSSKVALLGAAVRLNRPIVSCMGAATRLDPFSVRVGDLSETAICPLAKMVRKRLHRQGIYTGIRCVYSLEVADTSRASETEEAENFVRGRARPSLGSISYMPAMFGLIAAREAMAMIVENQPCPEDGIKKIAPTGTCLPE